MENMNEIEMAICREVAAFVSRYISRARFISGSHRIENHPERFLHVKIGDDGQVLLSLAEEVSLDYFGDIISSREWLVAELLLEGLHLRLTHPLPQLPDGKCDYTHAQNVGTPEGLLQFFQHVRPNKKNPLFESKALRVRRAYTETVGSRDRNAAWPTHGRPVAAINKWLKRFAIPTLDTTQGNALLAVIDETLQQHKAKCEWFEGSIGLFYNRHSNVPYSSCMAGKPEEWFALYDHMAERGQLKLLNITRNDEHIGRALVWFGSNPDDKYLDRVYAPPYRDSFEPDVVQGIKDFCAAEGITKCVFRQTEERIGLQHVGAFSIDTGCYPSDFECYPYVDSMRHYCDDGKLRNSASHGGVVLDCTDGGPDSGDYVTLENGDRVPEDDARYSLLFGEWYSEDDVTWSELHDSWIPDDHMIELHDGKITFRDNGEVVSLHDGEYALIEDCVQLHDGEYALSEHAQELHDGEYALCGDCVQMYDGEYALCDDTRTLPDGRVVLHDDCTETEEGVWALTSELND